MSEYAIVGQPVPRIDGPLKVTGQAVYADDLYMPGMLYGKILRSPYAHAKILNIDTSQAEKLPGVRAVITGKDFPQILFGFIPDTRDRLAWTVDKVRHYGEAVAAVAAVDEETAEEALELIKVDYEPLPVILTAEEATRPGAPLIHDRYANNIAARGKTQFGDVEQGFRESDHIREVKFHSARVHPGFLEPHAILAYVDATGTVVIQASKQSPYITWRHLCRGMGLPLNKVRLVNPYVGAGFSGKHDPFDLDFAAVKLAMKTSRPVKIVHTMEEVLSTQRQRHSKDAWIKLGMRRDGTIMACDLKLVSEGGAYAGVAALNVNLFGWTILLSPYRIPHGRYEGYRVYTNKPVCGAVRGQAVTISRFVFESILSQMADDLGIDQVEIRVKNAYRDGDTNPIGVKIDNIKFVDTILKVAEAIGWKEKKANPVPYRGIGFGSCGGATAGARPWTGYTSGASVVKVNEDATATLIHGGTEIGQGIDTVMAQISAEVLGLRMEDIRIVEEDTDTTLLEAGMYASRGTVWAGNAVMFAAQDARRQLAKVASEMLEVSAEDIDFRDRRVFLRDSPERGVPLLDVVRRAYYYLGQPVYGRGSWTAPIIEGQPFAHCWLSQATEVEMDPETGKVKVLKSVVADEMGRVINPMQMAGQMEGNCIFTQGEAFAEEILVDDQGRPLNANFLDYKMPTVMEAPEQEVYHILCPSEHGPFGAKGGGEATAGLAAAVNALSAASGVYFTEVPITPQKILKALKEKKP